MHELSRIALATVVACAAVAAQQQPAYADLTIVDGMGTEPVPGLLPGTFRFNVTFQKRPFDLTGFRTAIESGASAAQMEAIVADLQQQTEQFQAPFARAVQAIGGRVVLQFWLVNACTIEIGRNQVAAVSAFDNVLAVRPDLPTYPLIKTSSNAANHNDDAVQAAGIGATGFGVAINDTGQDSDMGTSGRPHQIYFRAGNINNHTGGGISGSRLVANVALGSFPADDINGHGTGVAGIAAGEIWNNSGGDRGHSNDAFIVGYSICDSSPACNSTLSLEASAWQRCAADKVKYNLVSANMSYGSSPDPLDVSQQAIDAAALNASIVACVAGGNSGPGPSSTGSSGAVCNGLAVAACNPTVKTIASFSSRGPLSTDPTRFYPDITGCGVNTVMPARDNETGTFVASGTSMATPQVTGAAGLVKAVRPASSAAEIKAVLLASTQDISAQNPGLDRNAFGEGFLRDDLAVALAQRAGTVLSSTIASTTTPNLHPITVTMGQTYTVCLVFYRHNLNSTAYSNLGLRVLNGSTVVASDSDARNLYQKVSFTAPITGTLNVQVSASTLEISPLPYSLATTATFSAGAPAAWANIGGGCAGTSGIPSLFPNANPVLGGTFVTRIAYAPPSSLALFFIGLSDTTYNGGPLPLDLTSLGAPGCFLRTDIAATDVATTDVNGTAAHAYLIPNIPSLVGAQLFQQLGAYDPTVNALGFTVSNAGAMTIGQF